MTVLARRQLIAVGAVDLTVEDVEDGINETASTSESITTTRAVTKTDLIEVAKEAANRGLIVRRT